jgi:hypothetical protein
MLLVSREQDVFDSVLDNLLVMLIQTAEIQEVVGMLFQPCTVCILWPVVGLRSTRPNESSPSSGHFVLSYDHVELE